MTVKVSAALLTETGGELQIDHIDVGDPGYGEVLVRNLASGICHSDETARSGAFPVSLPLVLGHEGAGIIEAVGASVTGFKSGDKVIGLSGPSCGAWWNCMNARPIQCEDSSAGWGEPRAYRNRTPLSALWGLGTFAEAMTVSERSVVKVETDLPFEQLALLGCSVTTGLGAVFNAAHVAPGNTVVVIGCGGVGQAIVQGARISGAARIIAVDPALLKREAAHRVGATDVVDPLACDPVEAVLELTGARRGVDIAFEAVGRSSLIRQAWQMTRPGGLAVVVGIPPDEPIDIGGLEFVVSGRRIMPSMNAEGFSKVEVPRFLSLVERGLVDLEGMISRNISLQNIKQCFENLDHIAVLRSVITF